MSNYLKIIVIVLIVILIIICLWKLLNQNYMERFMDNSDVTYKITFESDWGENPNINHPKDPHTGNMFLITHNNNVILFEIGKLASHAISQSAQWGTVDELVDMFKNNENIKKIYTAPVLGTPGSKSFDVAVNSDNSFISLTTMIAPSPSLMTGVSNINLLDRSGWIDNMTIPLYILDAGTAVGTEFRNEPKIQRRPPVPINTVSSSWVFPDMKSVPVGYLKVQKV
jgi:hypothetical protein